MLVIPMFDGFWGVVHSLPWFALGTFTLVLAANLVADLLYAAVDPRIRRA